MNEGKSKVNVLKHRNAGRQTSIRSFFSANFRKTIANDDIKDISSSQISDVDAPENERKPTTSQNVKTTADRNTTSCKSITERNRDLNLAKPPSNKTASFSAVKSEKRKHKADDVLTDLLDELENSSPEEYIYLQSFAPSKNHTNKKFQQEIRVNPSAKRLKLSPSTLAEEKCLVKNDDDSKEKPNTKLDHPCDRNETNNTSLAQIDMKSSTTLIDIENLDELFVNDCDDWLTSANDLNLNEWTYCKIISIDRSTKGLRLTLQKHVKSFSNAASSPTTCVLQGCWFDTPLKTDDVVCIKAHFDSKNGHWLVNNDQGFVTVHPDVLITGTGVVGSLFCQRRSVLSYIFPGYDPPNIAMVVGSLVHELLQEVLRKQIRTLEDIRCVMEDLIASKRTLHLAYECGVALGELKSQLDEFSPKIFSFVNTYMSGGNTNTHKTWLAEILQVVSIEENFWVPQLGIKGKTDVILNIRKEDKIHVMPLELKTGRATNSSEHRGQIILYLMMMNETNTVVDTGLLFYLKENKLTEITPKHAEQSGLMSMRNSLVSYIVTNQTPVLNSQNEFELPNLPEPIHHHSGCAKCPYLTACSASLSKQDRENMSDVNPLRKLGATALAHLTESHLRYVFFWLGLLKLEESERKKRDRTFDISDLWHVPTNERVKRGYCVSELRLRSVRTVGSRFLHKMERVSNNASSSSACALADGDYVVVSKGSRYAIASGYVDSLLEREITLKLDRQLDADDVTCFVVDKHSVFDGLLGFNTSSLLLLLENTSAAANLRSFVVDMALPSFTGQLPDYDASTLKGLNVAQRNAIIKTLQADDYTLIKGMPGTGKTATIVALVQLLVSLGHSVLITSHTHSAVDNILLRLKGRVDFLRLGSHVRVHDSLKSYCEDYLLEKRDLRSVSDLEKFYDEKVVAVTCMGCSHVLFKKRQFDYCIVDEATQVLQPSVIKSLYSSRKFVLLGDPQQLPPVVQSEKASALGLSDSLFVRLDRPEATSVLYLQYRMNSAIMQLANLFAYENALKCENEQINSATIDVDPSKLVSFQDWMRLALSHESNRSVIVLNTSLVQTVPPTSEYSNRIEADIVTSIVNTLHQVTNTKYEIGVIAPFREQVELLRKATPAEYAIEINTVDQYQGRDKDVIIYSCTKTTSTQDSGILSDKRRLTVAITRAKRKLIVIANVNTLRTYAVFDELFNHIPKRNIVDIATL